MTSAHLTDTQSVPEAGFAGILRGRIHALAAWWSRYRTTRILSGLDDRTLKDIGATVPGGASAAVEARVLRHLESLR
ncbi:DUF1127 domain-containing protein [Microbaculum marinum]|uniref:DUF1127 domain-containing protein n=1 Tax=Microbaculum marinum TaxID=1764581 RepID=A0AAW9RX17_9HYPH